MGWHQALAFCNLSLDAYFKRLDQHRAAYRAGLMDYPTYRQTVDRTDRAYLARASIRDGRLDRATTNYWGN